MSQIHITAKGIKSALKRYTPYQSLVEYVWNGFDAKATALEINFIADEMGGVAQIEIKDNGYGIAQNLLKEKFEPFFESKKKTESKSPKNNSVLHGKNGIGRLTFFTFARHAQWRTVFAQEEKNFFYDIYANAETINLYSGTNAAKRETSEQTGTAVRFSGIYGLTIADLGSPFLEFLSKEFGWFLELNKRRNFSLKINDTELDYSWMIAESEKLELTHEENKTFFDVTYVRWHEKFNNEQSKYYYLGCDFVEKWKEPTSIKTKGEKFFHSVFIASPYFDSFSFNTSEEDQSALLGGTRSDKQFKFLRRAVAKLLRIKRRPFLKEYAQNLIETYAGEGIFEVLGLDTAGSVRVENLRQVLRTLYEIQPRLFSSLNSEQKKMLVGLWSLLLISDKKEEIETVLEKIIDLSEEEKDELKNLFTKKESSALYEAEDHAMIQ